MNDERLWRISLSVMFASLGSTSAALGRAGFSPSVIHSSSELIGPLQDPVTWYGINYAGTQMTQWDFQNKGTHTSPARLSFVLEVPLRHLRPSVIYSAPCDRMLQRAYSSNIRAAYTSSADLKKITKNLQTKVNSNTTTSTTTVSAATTNNNNNYHNHIDDDDDDDDKSLLFRPPVESLIHR